jgi:hypothetical protein
VRKDQEGEDGVNCPFAVPGRQEACLSLQKQRTALMTREYDRNECYSCPMRRKRLEGAQEPERIAIPTAQFNKPETITPKKEMSMADDKAKERVLSRILREKACSRGRLMNYCGVSKDELEAVTVALVADGKIKLWRRGGRAFTPHPTPRIRTWLQVLPRRRRRRRTTQPYRRNRPGLSTVRRRAPQVNLLLTTGSLSPPTAPATSPR